MIQQNGSSGMQGLKLDDFLKMVDIATTVRKKQDEVSQQLDIGDVRAELKKKLLDTAKISGETLSDSQAESAIDHYFDGLYSFKEPRRDFGTKAAEVYVERSRLGKKFGIPPLIAGVAAGLIWLGAGAINSANLRSQERSVEAAVMSAYQDRQKLSIETKEILSSPILEVIPTAERSKLQSEVSNAQQRFASMNSFFDKYCSDGTAEDDVTRENYAEARSSLAATEDSLDKARTGIKDGKLVIRTQEGLTLAHRSLDTLLGEIRGLKPLEIFSQRAEIAYSAGIGEIERRNLNGAKEKEKELGNVRNDIHQFSNLASQTETLYGNIRAVAKEEEATRKGEALYGEAKQLAASADVPRLSQAVSQLQNLNAILNQEYTLRIVSRPGVKSGIDRYYTDKNGKRASGFYIMLEGVDSRGNVLQMNIKNEEDGRTGRVSMWGERVPQQVYERVKSDKIDNGRIDNDVVGKKRRGYLREEMTMPGVTKQGQITDW